MSRIYLVRHGQAGTRKVYDSLSDLGKRQARLLGEYFISEGIEFSAAYRGNMLRHEKTAAEVIAAYKEAGHPFPDVILAPRWNEFDLDAIYRALAPRLSAQDPVFKREYDEMMAQASAADRRWMPCDTKVVAAWIGGQHPYEGESWDAFHSRVIECQAELDAAERHKNVVIFTSATPIGIWTALTMDIADHRAMKLAGVLQNASYTMIRLHDGELRLHIFNAIPHLPAKELRSYR